MKSQPGSTSMDAESQIAETLKHAPGMVRRKANVSILTMYYITDNMYV